MRDLLQLNDKVAGEVALTVISLLVKGETSGLLEARLDLHIQLFPLSLGRPSIMLEHLPFILHLLEAPIVEFIERALQYNHYVLRRRAHWLVLSSKGISEQTSELV